MEVLKFRAGVIKSKTWVITSQKVSHLLLKYLNKRANTSSLHTEQKCEELTVTSFSISLFSLFGICCLPPYV